METKNKVISIRLVYVVLALLIVMIGIIKLIPHFSSNQEIAKIDYEPSAINRIELADANNITSRGSSEERQRTISSEVIKPEVIEEEKVENEQVEETKNLDENNEQIVQEESSQKEVINEKENIVEQNNTNTENEENEENVEENVDNNENLEEEEEEEEETVSISNVQISVGMDLTERTGLSKADFVNLMEGVRYDTSGFFAENAETIYDICEEYDINEIFFCGLISAESGWNIASNHRRTYNYISMMSGGKLIQFDSVEDGLTSAAILLHNKYLSKGGAFYHGATLSGVQKCFCPSGSWVQLVFGRMKQILD